MKTILTVKNVIRSALKAMNYPTSMISNWIRRLLMIRTVRKSKLLPEDKDLIEELCRDRWTDQGASLRTVQKVLRQRGTNVCLETIRKFLNNQPWGRLKRQPRTFMMTQKNKIDRRAFAERLQAEGLLTGENGRNFAKSILFTDEKYFELTHKPNPQNHRYRGDISKVKIQKVPKFDQKVLVYGGFTFKGVTPIKFIDETINMHNYTGEILPFYKAQFERNSRGLGILEDSLFDENGAYFQQDGAKPHTARISKAYINANFPNWLPDWPGNSPDLNPIENLWSIVQSKVDHYPFATTIEELKRRIKKAWAEIDPLHLRSLALCFPRRLEAILNK